MTYPASQLITNAFYLSQLVSQDLDTLTSSQIATGLQLLNALLSFKSSDGALIPYYNLVQETLTAGQESYFYQGLVWVESVTFNIGNIRYSMTEVDRKTYFGDSRIDNLTSLPYQYRAERSLDGTTLYFYFLPDGNYPIHIMGKYALTNISNLATDLETYYDDFYIEYLRYCLAQMICNNYGVELLPQTMSLLKQYESHLRGTNVPDLTMKKTSTFIIQPGINYGDVNLGRGWRP